MLVQQISSPELQINVFAPRWLKERPQTVYSILLQCCCKPPQPQSVRHKDVEEIIMPLPPSLPEPASCFYSSSNWLFKLTLQPFDQLRHINKLSLCCRCYGWKNLLILPPHQKSAIDSSKCIFILIKQNQIRSRNTSLTLYWNWPAVQCTLNSAVWSFLLCSFFTSMTINTGRMFWFMLLMCLGAPESILLSS